MKTLRIILSILIIVMVLILPTRPISADGLAQTRTSSNASLVSKSLQTYTSDSGYKQDFPVVINAGTTCHFGIAVINNPSNSLSSFDLSTLGVGNYLDWARQRNPSVPANVDYYNVLNVSDAAYNTTYASLHSLLTNNPGATWLVGNEPDSEVTYQDHIPAETYADRFYNIATYIRSHDSLAKIGFGTIIQPTAIRLHYLTLAMNKLVADAGSADLAHQLIDIYSIHAFILNEERMYYPNDPVAHSWGAGFPIGYDSSWGAPEVIDIPAGQTFKTYDINIFKQHVINFRQWMKDQGDPNKPLWITEYGSLFPSQGNEFLTVSDTDTANYMTQTFDFMLGYKDPSLGFADDSFRLVQKWDWYSLNEQVDKFGGSFYNPNTHLLTPVGQRFIQYDPSTTDVPFQNPDVSVITNSFSITPYSLTNTPGLVDYKFNLSFSNTLSSDRSTGVQIDIYDNSNPTTPISIYHSPLTNLPRCSGATKVVLLMKDLVPGSSHSYSASINLLAGNGIDTNPANNQVTFNNVTVPLYPSYVTYFPVTFK
jgi:hypothetical protein